MLDISVRLRTRLGTSLSAGLSTFLRSLLGCVLVRVDGLVLEDLDELVETSGNLWAC